MDLPVTPPLAPMLAKLSRKLPVAEGLWYEPKWDGFRCLAFRDDDEVELRSRNDRPLARYFPELVDGLRAVAHPRFVLDGEIVVSRADTPSPGAGLGGRPPGLGDFDFSALLERLHPAASRVARLRAQHPASFIAFDLVAAAELDLRDTPFEQRRVLLAALLADTLPPLFLTPATRDPELAAAWLEHAHGHGVDGVIVKHPELRYEPDKRAMTKVKHERTADCVVAGFRWHGGERAVGSLLLGLYDEHGTLRHVGICPRFSAVRRRQLLEDVLPHVTVLQGHPWERGFHLEASPIGRLPGAVSRWQPGRELTWVPLRPELVAEVAYDHLEGDRFRHAPAFRRWRGDRDPRSCTYEQFAHDEQA